MKFSPMPEHILRLLMKAAFSTVYHFQIQNQLTKHKNAQRLERFFYARVTGYRKPLPCTNHNKPMPFPKPFINMVQV